MLPSIFILEIKLLNTSPMVWRIVEVKQTATLHELHAVIQAAMGWYNSHLYSFKKINGKNTMEFILPEYEDPEMPYSGNNPREFKIKDIFRNEGDTIEYLYDFGDYWEHSIIFRGKSRPRSVGNYPACVAGARRCPPEDVGGKGGYKKMLKTIENKNKKELLEYREWLGYEYDPDDFAPDRYNIYFTRTVKRYVRRN